MTQQEFLEMAKLRHTAEIYAQGADRRDKELWRQVIAGDCVLSGPGFAWEGIGEILSVLDLLQNRFRATRHNIHQCVATASGDTAQGETYCTAEHLLQDSDQVLIWSIRYQDRWRREAGLWRFTQRHLILDWEETRSCKPGEQRQ